VSKKDSLIADAQKFLQKGQTDKAISCYQEALVVDPADLRVRQRLAELLAKHRRVDEARKELETIGKNLTASGFYLKALAVYKQIEKLFPEDIGIALTLASLNEKHGLSANALSEYKRAFDQYELLQNYVEALKALEAMQRIDAQNPAIKLKYAEMLFRQGMLDESLEAFRSLGLLLVERRDDGAFARLAERVAQIFPGKDDFSFAVIEQKIVGGSAEQAAAVLQALVKNNPRQLQVWRLLVLAYRTLGNNARLKTICQHCIRFFPSELFPREQLVRCLLEEHDAEEALTVLNQSEQLFLASGAAGTLRELFLALNDLAPITFDILKGCAQACLAAGNSEEAASFAAKIDSLAGLEATEQPDSDRQLQGYEELLPECELEQQPEVSGLCEEIILESEQETGFSESEERELTEASTSFDPDFYEIEVELDDDFVATPVDVPTDSWFETVNNILGNIQTETGKVRFGAGVDNGDSRTQYDLGLAFYEMGLFDEAINAFRQASEDPERRVACLILQSACLRGKGEVQLAESALRALSVSPDLTTEDRCALDYELALICTAAGKSDEAWALFEEIERRHPDYRDVTARLSDASEGKTAGGLDFSEDELLDFDLK